MAQINFPAASESPWYNPDNGVTYEYVGGTWRTVTDNGSSLDDIYVKEIGDTMTGELILYGNPAQNLGATPKQYVDTEITNAISGSEGSETGRLDGRYLRKDSAAGNQTVASTGTTTFDGLVEAGDGVKVTGGDETTIFNGIGSRYFGDQRLLIFAGGEIPAQFAFDGTTVLGFSGVAAGKDSLTIRSDEAPSVAGGSNLINFQGRNSGDVDSTFGKFGTVLEENAGAGGGIAKFSFDLNSGGGLVEKTYIGARANFSVNSTYIGGTATRNTRELWESTLTEEQLEQLSAGTLAIPANVSTPGDGSFVRQWWYDQQSAEDQALIDAGELDYPERYQAANFVDTFVLGVDTNINLLATEGRGEFSGGIELPGTIGAGKIEDGIGKSGDSFVFRHNSVSRMEIRADRTEVATPDSADSRGFSVVADNTNTTPNIICYEAYLASSTNKVTNYTGFVANARNNVSSTQNIGFDVIAQLANNNVDAAYGFRSNLTSIAGKDIYNFYANGSAPNYFAGNIDCDGLINELTVGMGGGSVATNTAIGHNALLNNTTGNQNTAIGRNALYNNTEGTNNTALGLGALVSNITGTNNTALGQNALYNNTGNLNTAVGQNALYNNTGTENTAIGQSALLSNVGGTKNTAVGQGALLNNTTGANNTAVGRGTLQNNTEGSGNIVIGGVNSLGNYVPVQDLTTEDDRIVMGTSSVTDAYVQVAWTVTSDARDKTNFAPVPYGLDFVKQLQPTAYQFKAGNRNARDPETNELIPVTAADELPIGPVRYGFKAQDILALEGDNPVIIDNENPDHLKYRGEALVPVLVNAIKEQQVLIDALTARLDALEAAQ